MKQTDYKRRNNHSKLNMTMIALVVSIIVLVMATFAWFVLSTTPEIKGMNFHVKAEQAIQVSQDGKNFSYSEDLSDKFNDVGALVPASTVDGLNWFVCKYDMSGNVLQGQDDTFGTQFQYMRFPNGGNVPNSTNSGKTEDNTSAQDANVSGSEETANKDTKQCYYIYTDIWLKTMDEKGVDVYLSVPNDVSDYKQEDTENTHYGSYVMSYHTNKTTTTDTDTTNGENGQDASIQLVQGGSETCARVGFQVLGTEKDAEIKSSSVTTDQFYIYEPNADRRSEADKTSEEYNADQYVAGFKAKVFFQNGGSTGANGSYIPTYPIKLNDNDEVKDSNENILSDSSFNQVAKALPSTDYDNTVRKWSIDGQGKNDTIGYKGYDGSISIFPSKQLIAQKSSTWKNNNTVTAKSLDSTMLGSMGKFLETSALYDNNKKLGNTSSDYTCVEVENMNRDSSSVSITTLEKNKPVKVRLFFWIEGQDVDCWNDIADTDFLVNLEFVGVPKNK